MRLRIIITALLLLGIVAPVGLLSAASAAGVLPALRTAAPARNMDVERAQLRKLIEQRAALIAQLTAQDGARGQALARTLLSAVAATLARDDGLLRAARQAAMTPAAPDSSAPNPTLTSAGPDLLWSPSARAWSPEQVSQALAAGTTGARAAVARPNVAPSLAMSLAALTSWAAIDPSASVSQQTPAPASTRAAAPPPGRALYLLPVDSSGTDATAHGALMVDSGSGAAPLVAANPTAAAALLQPTALPQGQASITATSVATPAEAAALHLPDATALSRRLAALDAALGQVRALDAWANANAPAPDITTTDTISSTDVLDQHIDHWTAGVVLVQTAPDTPSSPALTATTSATPTATMIVPALPAPRLGLGLPVRAPALAPAPAESATPDASPTPLPSDANVPALALGATLALTSGMGNDPNDGVALNMTLAPQGAGALAVTTISDTTATDLAANLIDAPITLAVVPSITATLSPTLALTSTPSTVLPEPDGTALAATPETTITATMGAGQALTATSSATPTDTLTAISSASATPTQAPSATGTPSATVMPSATVTPSTPPSATITTTTPSASAPSTDTITATVMATTTASATVTAPVSNATPTTSTAPITTLASLDLSIVGAATILTVTTGVSSTDAMTLVATLPISAAQALDAPAFLQQRGALDSVLTQGATLFAQLQTSENNALQTYRAELNRVAALNTTIEQQWDARYSAYIHYHATYPAYVRRKAAFDAYAHRLHLSIIARQQWQQRMAAWTRYAQQLAAYRAALAACVRPPIAPISGTTPLSGTANQCAALPLRPEPPVFPGPQPAPFTEQPPAWPGTPPLFASDPGPEPSGYALPLPPEAIPPWDGSLGLITDLTFNGAAPGVDPAGREETTQSALLADGALDGVPSFQDPIKGIITTYWGGQTIFQSFHTGVDIAAPMYTPIHAAAAGRVVWAGYAVAGQRHESYGLCVIIQHNARFSTLYAHMDDQKYGLMVRVGDTVQQGQVIGYEGMTGWTTGPHLHFEMRENNVQFNPLLLIPNPQD